MADEELVTSEEELDTLGLKAKPDEALVDIDDTDVEAVADPLDVIADEEPEEEKGMFGDDPELEAYMINGHDE